MVRVKVCCIASEEEIRLAISAGASALGFVSAMPSGPGVIAEEIISHLTPQVPPGVASFLLTSQEDFSSLVVQQKRCGAGVLQLVDRVPVEVLAALRQELPGIALVQVIHVTGEESLAEALAVAPFVQALLLDSGNPTLAVKELGGTGRVHDRTISRRIREQCGVPVYLAGGLNTENVEAAIKAVQPFGLDVCTGVRTEGRLDPEKLTRFITAAHRTVVSDTAALPTV
ncbi:MAG: phosphoribosylanthranilate isomerase [Armatimonadaceae bacterium]